MVILIAVLVVFGLIGLILWLGKSREINWEKLRGEASIWCEVAYQAGYTDFKSGKSQESCWDDVIATTKNDLQRNILSALKHAYQEGLQDAMNGLPSKSKQLRQLRQEQLDTLKRMQIILTNIKSSLA